MCCIIVGDKVVPNTADSVAYLSQKSRFDPTLVPVEGNAHFSTILKK